jgi:hypothetical protein
MIPIPGPLMDKIGEAVRDATEVEVLEETLLRLYWKPEAVDDNSLMAFVGEFTKRPNDRNRNQLLADLLTAQSQRRAFGLPDIIIWGPYALQANFRCTLPDNRKVWPNTSPNSVSKADFLLHKFVQWSAHHTWDLTAPIDFLACYCFLCSLSNNLSEAPKHRSSSSCPKLRRVSLVCVFPTSAQGKSKTSASG